MNLTSYLFVVAFYMLGGGYLYILMRRVLSHFIDRKMKMVKNISLAVSSVLILGGVGLSTFTFLYLSK